jgi:hypothetical protein
MEIITTFLATTPMVIFLVPVILILVVLLVVLNKSHTAEVIPQVPVPPVTTTPAPASEGEVVSQEIKPVVEQVVTPEKVPAPVSVVPQAEQAEIKEEVTPEVVVPVEPTPTPVSVPEPTPISVPTPAPVQMPVTEAPIAPTVPPVASWHPQEPVMVVDETPVAPEMHVATPLNQEISPVTEQMPAVSDAISPLAVSKEVVETTPLVQEESSSSITTPSQAI